MPMAATAVEIRKLKVHADARGAVFEPLEPSPLDGWRNVHTVISEPGAVRGNHRHVRGTEVTAVLGPALVRYRCGAQIEERHVPAGEAWRFVFPPGTAMRSRTPALCRACSCPSTPRNTMAPDRMRSAKS
jgi:hypothetical protein